MIEFFDGAFNDEGENGDCKEYVHKSFAFKYQNSNTYINISY